MNNIPDHEFLMSKRDFMLNSLTLGIAVELLSRGLRIPEDICLNILFQEAEIRMTRQNPQSIEEFIIQYYTGRQNKAKTIVTGFPTRKTA